MISRLVKGWLVSRKGLIAEESLQGWEAHEMLSFLWVLTRRLLRGELLRRRLGHTSGRVLCERNVRVIHGRHISAGKLLNLEDGCELIGFSKRGIVFGERCTVGRLATIRPTNILLDEPGEGLRLGDHSNIGVCSFVGCNSYVDIGSHLMMGPSITLLAESHQFDDPAQSIKHQGVSRNTIRIEDGCWIGAGSIIRPGVTIGRGSIVAAGSVVKKDTAPYSVVAGAPAQLVRSRRPEESGPSS